MGKKFRCEKCGSKNIQISYTGHGAVLYCYDCGEYIKDLSDDEISKARKQMQMQKNDKKY